MIKIIKQAALSLLLFLSCEIQAQTNLKSHLLGKWIVKSTYDIGAQIPASSKSQIQAFQNGFLNSKFHFKNDNSFSLDTQFEEMIVKNGHWKILHDNNQLVIQEWKDKDKRLPIIMGINVLIKDEKTIFMIEETFFAFEMTKVSDE